MKYLYLFGIFVAISLFALMAPNSHRYPLPDPQEAIPVEEESAVIPELSFFVVDASKVLSDLQKEDLEETVRGINNGLDLRAVAILIPSFGGISPEEYGAILVNKWREQSSNDRTIVLIISTEEGVVRVEVSGSLQKFIAESTLESIVTSYMVPHLKVGDWYSALNDGLLAIAGQVAQ
jgi:uncharacterized membrane protein YgcG